MCWMAQCMMEEQWILFISTLVMLSTLHPTTSSWTSTGEIWVRWWGGLNTAWTAEITAEVRLQPVVCPWGQYCSAWIAISPGTRTGRDWQDREQLGRKEISGSGGQQGDHEPAMWCCCKEGKQLPGRHQAGYCLQEEERDPHPPFSTGDGHLECYAQCWAPWYKRGSDVLEQVQLKASKVIKDLEHNYWKGGFVRWGSVSSATSSVKEHGEEALSCARGGSD